LCVDIDTTQSASYSFQEYSTLYSATTLRKGVKWVGSARKVCLLYRAHYLGPIWTVDRQRSPTKAAWIGRWNMVLWCYGAMEHGIWYMAMNMQMTDEIFMNAAAPINIIIGPIINAHPYVYKYLGAYVCASMPGCLCCCHSEVSQGFAYKKSNGFMGCQCRWRIESVRSPICICITQWNHFEKSNRRTKYST